MIYGYGSMTMFFISYYGGEQRNEDMHREK